MTQMKAYIWDLDGTLLDSYGCIVSSLADTAKPQADTRLTSRFPQAAA